MIDYDVQNSKINFKDAMLCYHLNRMVLLCPSLRTLVTLVHNPLLLVQTIDYDHTCCEVGIRG